jgi:hypothetical protein
LGEACLSAGRLDDADHALTRALKIREATAAGGLGLGPRLDAAATRDNLAALREAQGRFDDAKALRLMGREEKEILCGFSEVGLPFTTHSLLEPSGGVHSGQYMVMKNIC